MIWVIGGTSEAREFLGLFEDKDKILVTVATEEGKRFIHGARTLIGRMSCEQMCEFIEKNGIRAIADLSHPFATVVTENANRAASESGISYFKYERNISEKFHEGLYLESFDKCVEVVRELKGTIFFTSGVKNLERFEQVKKTNRFVHRIIPSAESLDICKRSKVEPRDIIAVVGPFSKEFNIIMFRDYNADYVVMKDSGDRGGTLEKLNACRELGIVPIIVERQDSEGIFSLVEMKREITGVLREENSIG